MADVKSKPSFSAGRRWVTGLNAAVGALAVLSLVVMVNYLAAGYFKRVQWGRASRVELSTQSRKLLQSLTNEVRVTIFFDTRGEDEVYGWIAGLLEEYQVVNPRLSVRTLDYTRFHEKSELFLQKNKLATLREKDFVFFESNGRTRICYRNELVDRDLGPVLRGESQEVRRSAFRGEMLFTSAIFSVTYPQAAKAYFVSGHGEHNPESAGAEDGYFRFASILKDELNVDWARVSLQGTNPVPADATLLVVAGPIRARFGDEELEKLETYLEQGRSLLVLLNNSVLTDHSGMERLLNRWGVAFLEGVVHDQKFAQGPEGFFATSLDANHPVTKPLASEGLQIYLAHPRAVGRAAADQVPRTANAPRVEVLAATGKEAVLIRPVPSDGGPKYEPRVGQFPLVVAVEKGGIKGLATGGTRILVVGDSLCLDNRLIENGANHYFAAFALNWLLDRPHYLVAGIGPKPVQEYKFLLTQHQMTVLRWILLGGLPGGILILGGLVWLRRRR